MACKLVIVLTLPCLVLVISSKEHLVQTICIPYSNGCMIFNDYANDADTYFTSDSFFYFMKGTHHLNVTLTIANVVNLTFIGDESDIILSNGCSIIWTNSSKLFLTSLNVFFNETNKTANNSAISIESTEVFTFSNVSFFKFYCELLFYSRAILVVGSSIVFESCRFENGFHSTGGTLYIEGSNVTFGGHNAFLNNTAHNTAGALYGLRSQIQLSGSGSFMRNRAGMEHVNNGTAIHVEFSSISLNGYFAFHNNQIKSSSCYVAHGGTIAAISSTLSMEGIVYFTNNSNFDGGAIMLYNSECLIKGLVEFEGNKAFKDGGAITAMYSSLNINSNEFHLYDNSEYINSEAFSKLGHQGVTFCNNSAENFGGAVFLFHSNMTLTGFVLFMENKAIHGGGIAIHYTSDSRICRPNLIIFQEPLDILFYSNVGQFGGALYIYDDYSDCSQVSNSSNFNCFFAVNGSTSIVQLNFTGNEAPEGAGIYGGGIQYCQVEVGNQKHEGYQVLQNLTKNSIKIPNEYGSSDSYEIRLCNDSIPDRVQRGQVFNISINILGDFDLPIIESVVLLQFTYDHQNTEINSQPYNNLRDKGCRNVGFIIFSKYPSVYLTLFPADCLVSSGGASLHVHIQLANCPPGYQLIGISCSCLESIFEVTGHNNLCNSSTGLIKCPQQDWMKPIFDENLTYEGFMWSPNCPAHLCRNDKDCWLNFSSDNVDRLCLEHRTAMLCGACLQNYSLTLGSLECSNCNSNSYLSLLLVFTLAGVALIASLLLLHITVADGTINGLIFYANLINIIKDIVFPPEKLPHDFLMIFISWLNLDFGIPTCFYTGLNYYSYTWLQFVFPFYLWFLVGLIIIACKYSSRAMKLFGSNPVAVLATVVLMSYSKLLHTSQQILSYVTVYYSNGTQEKRWKMDPNLLYFQGKHLPLAMFGLFIITVFLLPYIVLLSFGHYLQKYSNKRGLKWLIKFKPILDAYYAPFYKKTRYWVGFLIFIRTSFSITYSILKNTEYIAILVIIPSVLTWIALIPWLQQKIYFKKCANILEGTFILNIIVLIILSLATNTTKEESKNRQSQLYTSIGIAFIECLTILAFHFWRRLKQGWLYIKSLNAKVFSNSKDLDKSERNVSTTSVLDVGELLLDDNAELLNF